MSGPGGPVVLAGAEALVEEPLPLLRLAGRVHATFTSILQQAVRTACLTGLTEEERFSHRALASYRLAGRLAELNGLRIHLAGALPSRPGVLVSNHLGYWDAIILNALLPLATIAKSEVANWPVLGWCGRALGTLYVRRGDVHHSARVLRMALRRLVAGVHLLNFPEGTTTSGQTVLAFRRGIFGIAARAGVPVYPVALRLQPTDAAWLGGERFFPHYQRHWRRGGWVEALVRFGRPLRPGEYTTPEACAAEARGRVLALLGRASA